MIICWKNKRSFDYTGDVLALFVTFLDSWALLCNSIFFFFFVGFGNSQILLLNICDLT